MNDIVLPERGSRWTIAGLGDVEVASVAKRGRGYQVYVDGLTTAEQTKFRLKDFLKMAVAK